MLLLLVDDAVLMMKLLRRVTCLVAMIIPETNTDLCVRKSTSELGVVDRLVDNAPSSRRRVDGAEDI